MTYTPRTLTTYTADGGAHYVTGSAAILVSASQPRLIQEALFKNLGAIDPEFEAIEEELNPHDPEMEALGAHEGRAPSLASTKMATALQFFGQICYLALGKKRTPFDKVGEYLGRIMEQRHGSVLEHANFTFLFLGVDRAMTHELVRHRAGMAYCLSGDTLVYSERRTHGRRNGPKPRRLDALYAMTQTPHGRSRLKLLRLRCLDETSGTFVTGRVKSVVQSGVKPVFRVTLDDGKSIACTREHRFLTPSGWRPLGEIVGGLAVTPSGVTLHGTLDTPLLVNGLPAYQDPAWLREHYVNKGLTQEQVGALAGVTHHCIRAWVRRHSLQKPAGSWTQGVAPWNKGRRYTLRSFHTPEARARFAEQKRGDKNPQWRGGVTSERAAISADVATMRPEIFRRDGYRCRLCGTPGGSLELHHILPVWSRPDIARDKDNIATVCRPCHTTRLNGHELDFVEVFGRSVSDVGVSAPPRARRTLRPHPVRIRRVEYLGEQMTYDIEMEGPNANFVANGIVTHNSQVSQRYTGPETLRFVMPYEDRQSPRLRRAFERDIETNLYQYINRIEALKKEYPQLDGEATTEYRKRIHGSARSVLGNYVEAPIVATGNARAWLHVLAMRCSKHADVRIREPMIDTLSALTAEMPEVFGHFELSPLADGTTCAAPRYEKP